MLRGRHRGLPVAIDRAVMLPFEFREESDSEEESEENTEHPTHDHSPNGDVPVEKNTRFQDPSPHRGVSFRSASADSRNQRRRRATTIVPEEAENEGPLEDV